MAKQPKGMFDAPIPGENYTSDTKNYPWHRPPEYTSLDDAIEAAAKKLTSKSGSVGVLTMIENGMTISHLTKTFILSGIGSGKWTLDFGLLMAGPVAHIMCLMAKAYDIDYEMGIDDEASHVPTKAFFKKLEEVDEEDAAEAGEEVMGQLDQVDMSGQSGGFMQMEGQAAETGGFMSDNPAEAMTNPEESAEAQGGY